MENEIQISSHSEKKNTPQNVSIVSNKLTKIEKKVYDFIKIHGEIMTSSVPSKMSGAIPNLKNKGLIEVFKKSTSRWTSKKRKFVRIRESKNGISKEK